MFGAIIIACTIALFAVGYLKERRSLKALENVAIALFIAVAFVLPTLWYINLVIKSFAEK